MRSGSMIGNCLLYYIILNLIFLPFIYGYRYLYFLYEFGEIEIIKITTIIITIILVLFILRMAYLAARLSSYHDEGIEDALAGALSEILLSIKLLIPFLGRDKDKNKGL